jgi:hypothetical protein
MAAANLMVAPNQPASWRALIASDIRRDDQARRYDPYWIIEASLSSTVIAKSLLHYLSYFTTAAV